MAALAIRQLNDDLVRVVVGIVVSLLVGMGVGTVARKTWGRLAKAGTSLSDLIHSPADLPNV
jgi:hypothetical protein